MFSTSQFTSRNLILMLGYLKLLFSLAVLITSICVVVAVLPEAKRITHVILNWRKDDCRSDFLNSIDKSVQHYYEDSENETVRYENAFNTYSDCMKSYTSESMGGAAQYSTLRGLSYLAVGVSVIFFGFSIYLLYGIHKKRPGILYRYMVFGWTIITTYTFFFVLGTIITSGITFFDSMSYSYFAFDVAILVILGCLFVYAFFLCIVLHAYTKMTSNNKESLKTSDRCLASSLETKPSALLFVLSHYKIVLSLAALIASICVVIVSVPEVVKRTENDIHWDKQSCSMQFRNSMVPGNVSEYIGDELYSYHMEYPDVSEAKDEYNKCMVESLHDHRNNVRQLVTLKILSNFAVAVSTLYLGFSLYLVRGINKRCPRILYRYLVFGVITLATYIVTCIIVTQNELIYPRWPYYDTIITVFRCQTLYALFLAVVLHDYLKMKPIGDQLLEKRSLYMNNGFLYCQRAFNVCAECISKTLRKLYE